MGLDPFSSDSQARREYGALIRRARIVGLCGAGICFLVSQMGLLWVLAMGGIGSNPSIAASIWLFSTLAAALFLFLVADSYRENPRWIRNATVASGLGGGDRDVQDRAPAKAS
jgi:hypothetical protein